MDKSNDWRIPNRRGETEIIDEGTLKKGVGPNQFLEDPTREGWDRKNAQKNLEGRGEIETMIKGTFQGGVTPKQ